MLAALRASPINPKENKKKKRQKKKKKESHIFKGVGLVCKVFGKKILPLLSIKKQTTEKKSVEIFFTKYILTLQTNSDAPLPLLSFLFFGYVCDSSTFTELKRC
jgi:hypothetical protein